MKKSLSPYFRTIILIALVVLLRLVAFGQATPLTGRESETEIFVRVAGWILISGAAISHIVSTIYAVIKGKNYEQVKEAADNYRRLYESAKAQNAELLADNLRLETENEKILEKFLRQ